MRPAITWEDYCEQKYNFFAKHGYEGVERSDLRPDGSIFKTVGFKDGAVWYELTENVTEHDIILRHGIYMDATFNFRRSEIWNTDNGTSRYLYMRA